MIQLLNKITSVRKWAIVLPSTLIAFALSLPLLLTSPVLASGTPYGSGTYNSGDYNGATTSASTSSSSTAAGTAPGTTTGSGTSSGTKAGSSTSTTPTGSTSTPSTTTENGDSGSASNAVPATTATTAPNSHAPIWIAGGAVLLLLAIGLLIWIAIRKKHHKNQPWDNPPPGQE